MSDDDRLEDAHVIFFFVGLALGIGGAVVYFLWLKDYELPSSFVSEALYWLVLTAVSVGVGLLVADEFAIAPNEYVKKGLQIAIIIGLLLSALFFGASDEINSVRMDTIQLFVTSLLAFIVGLFVWKVHRLPVYGPFLYLVFLTTGIGFTWFARVTGSTEGQLIAGSFLVGGLLYFGDMYIRKGFEQGR